MPEEKSQRLKEYQENYSKANRSKKSQFNDQYINNIRAK